MEEHARRYTTNQDNFRPKHISNNWKMIDYSLKHGITKRSLVFHNYFNCVQLLCYQGFFTSGKTLPLFFKSLPPLRLPCPKNQMIFSFFSLLSHIIPQVKISDYVTIQKQGPYLQQLHIRLSLFMYTGALRLLWVRMTGC